MKFIESSKELELLTSGEVIVCGGGPAGIGAAVSAARKGVRTVLLESAGCLGGIWTSGLLSYILGDCKQHGLVTEIKDRFASFIEPDARLPKSLPSPEKVKLYLEELCLDAGVELLYNSKVCGTLMTDKFIQAVCVETPAGRRAVSGDVFIDCTGNGDVGFHAGCGFDVGNETDGSVQPMSMLAIIGGIKADECIDYVNGSEEAYQKLGNLIRGCGIEPSYSRSSIIRISDDIFMFAGNHQYGVRADDPHGVTRATVEARHEIHSQINALRSLGGIWKDIKVVATSSQIGVRDGRRLHGLYKLELDDLTSGRCFDDAVCKVRFGVDVHALTPDSNRGLTSVSRENPVQPYDIPMRALISRDCDNLMMAGRCISGSFYAHASYRVTGIAIPCGEAAGNHAAQCCITKSTVKSEMINDNNLIKENWYEQDKRKIS
ncbi:MAG: FAD-dependent oxidoreductase [Victivallales bacterium]|nr:FAD-dependent oxidoreductase [Victivallales bacterium]